MSKYLNKALLAVAVGFLLTGAACSASKTAVNALGNVNAKAGTIVNAVTKTVTYTGTAGKNALDLLQAGHTVDVSKEGFVNSIDGVKPGAKQFWSLSVNGKPAAVGAKDYVTKPGDQIEWKLESF